MAAAAPHFALVLRVVMEIEVRRLGRMIGAAGHPTVVVQEGGYRVRTLGVNARNFFTGLAEGVQHLGVVLRPHWRLTGSNGAILVDVALIAVERDGRRGCALVR